MTWSEIYLFCFAVGAVWCVASLLLGGMHLHLPKLGFHGTHGVHGGHAASHGHGHSPIKAGNGGGRECSGSLLGSLINPSCFAIFLVWFGGAGYLVERHSTLMFWLGMSVSILIGLAGAFALASFLRFLESREQPLDPADYELVGTLGRVSAPIRASGVGEMIYVRDGTRRPLCIRSEDGEEIGRDAEVIVTRYERGIAYVRTWEAMTQFEGRR